MKDYIEVIISIKGQEFSTKMSIDENQNFTHAWYNIQKEVPKTLFTSIIDYFRTN